MRPKRIAVSSSAGAYSVVCGFGAVRRASAEVATVGKFSSVHVVTSRRVWNGVGKRVLRGLGGRGAALVHFVDDAERKKDLRTVEIASRGLVSSGADRRCLVVAVGGGVIGDVAGFVAASYLRGVALVHIPTTLVAQVDSSIGGKTGVNLPEGKNLVGAFYPPRLVLSDPEMLSTLPEREFRGGLAEVIKHGVIADPGMFGYLEKNFDKVLRRDRGALEYLIPANVKIKARVVSQDERESGLREILNFGHTFGHALETVTGYRRYQHGEAVAWGMMAAALLGHEIGVTPADDASRIVALVRRLGRLPAWPTVAPEVLIAAMGADKKTRAGKLRFVLVRRIGKAASFDDVPLAAVRQVLRFAPELVSRMASKSPGKHVSAHD
jgi:3-dehydroquinate synthase